MNFPNDSKIIHDLCTLDTILTLALRYPVNFVHILGHSLSKFFISPYLIYHVGPQPPCQIKEECKWFYQAV